MNYIKRGMQKKSLEFLALVQKILDDYDFPLTIRQIFYQMVARQYFPKEERYYKKVSRLCVKGRDIGLLPEDKFDDRTRILDKQSVWLNLNSFMGTVKVSYHKNKWLGQSKFIEIWSEKDALRSVISKITYKYGVGLMIARGQYPRTGIYHTALRFRANADKESYLYYVGDYDPSGLSIPNSIKKRLEDFDIYCKFERIGLTQDQIDKYKLPFGKAKKSDKNYKRFVEITGSDRVTELDALPPDVLRSIIEEAITKNIDWELWNPIQEKEEIEQVGLDKFIDKEVKNWLDSNEFN